MPKLFQGNPRRISKKRYNELIASLDELGDISGIVHDLNSDQIIGGNQRSTVFDVTKMQPVITMQLDAPNKQGTAAIGYVEWHGEMFSYRAVRWTPEQCRKGNIKANIAAGAWDWDTLAGWPSEQLQAWGFDAEMLATWNADGAALATMLEAEQPQGDADAEPQIDRAAELNEKWQVQRGDLWRIGAHRLLCGDSTVREDVERVMGGEKAQMMFTDPPYGVDYTGGHFHSGDVNIKRERERLSGDNDTALYAEFLPVVLPFIDGPCYMWFAGSRALDVYSAVDGNKCEIHALIIWHKINATYAAMNAQYKQRHEPCLYFKPNGSTLRWIGPTDECTVWEVKRDPSNEFHPTQKPVELAVRAIGNHDARICVDWFAGSGTTLVACQNLQRKCRAVEISQNYCAVILERMATAFPGIEIERISEAVLTS